jgi:GlpG protein
MNKVLETDIQADLSLFSNYLWQLGIQHRVNESSGNQLLWVARAEHKQQVLELYDEFTNGSLRLSLVPLDAEPQGAGYLSDILELYRRFPAVLTLILICLICFPLTMGFEQGAMTDQLHWLTFVDFQIRDDLVYSADLAHNLKTGELWRLWTPMFIHFGWAHLLFNLLWIWEIGRRIELLHKASTILIIAGVSSVVANLTQYWLSGPVLFGGISGVVYAFLGYALVWSYRRPNRSFGLPPGLYIFMLVWLLLGVSGVLDKLNFGSVANGAHLGGVIAGAVLGLMASLLSERSSER